MQALDGFVEKAAAALAAEEGGRQADNENARHMQKGEKDLEAGRSEARGGGLAEQKGASAAAEGRRGRSTRGDGPKHEECRAIEEQWHGDQAEKATPAATASNAKRSDIPPEVEVPSTESAERSTSLS